MKMIQSCLIGLIALSTFSFAPGVHADDAEKTKAINLVNKAIDFYKANGAAKTFAEISRATGQIHDGALYAFVYDNKGELKAHGFKPKWIGQNKLDFKDPDGKFYVKEFINTKTESWVDYKQVNPETNKLEAKTTYVKREGEYVFGCGIYKTK